MRLQGLALNELSLHGGSFSFLPTSIHDRCVQAQRKSSGTEIASEQLSGKKLWLPWHAEWQHPERKRLPVQVLVILSSHPKHDFLSRIGRKDFLAGGRSWKSKVTK